MDRQSTFLLALGMLIAAGLIVSVSGWILFMRDRFMRDRRAGRSESASAGPPQAEARIGGSESGGGAGAGSGGGVGIGDGSGDGG
ncbi:MAG: hypothetical protein L0206_23295 [Actinobacteria bacterium]|nr:hypothetical protein [Actinomycetota bacterium]